MWEEQNEDFETDKVREDLEIKLTDKQYSNLKLMAYRAGFKSVGDLLSSFVGDLTGWHSNGSDERNLADSWYDRAFGMSEFYSYFRHHLFNYDYDLDNMKEMIEDVVLFEEAYEEYVNENEGKTNESKEECLKVLKEIIENDKEL